MGQRMKDKLPLIIAMFCMLSLSDGDVEKTVRSALADETIAHINSEK